MNSIFMLRALAEQNIPQLHDNRCCRAAEKPATHALSSRLKKINALDADGPDLSRRGLFTRGKLGASSHVLREILNGVVISTELVVHPCKFRRIQGFDAGQ